MQVAGLLAIVAIGAPHLGDENLLAGASTAGVVTRGGPGVLRVRRIRRGHHAGRRDHQPGPRLSRGRCSAALGISTVLYVGVAIAGVSVLGPARLGPARNSQLADVMGAAIGSRSAEVVAVVAMMATTNTTLLADHRFVAPAVRNGRYRGRFPSSFGSDQPAASAPWVAVLLAVTVAAGFVGLGDLSLVASVTDFSVYLVFIAVNVTVILLRFWQPKRRRPFAIRGAVGKVPVRPRAGAGDDCRCSCPHSTRRQSCWARRSPSAALVAVLHAGNGFRPHIDPSRANTGRPDDAQNQHPLRAEAAEVADILRVDFAAVDFDSRPVPPRNARSSSSTAPVTPTRTSPTTTS